MRWLSAWAIAAALAVSKNPSFDFTKPFNGQWLALVVTDVTEAQ